MIFKKYQEVVWPCQLGSPCRDHKDTASHNFQFIHFKSLDFHHNLRPDILHTMNAEFFLCELFYYQPKIHHATYNFFFKVPGGLGGHRRWFLPVASYFWTPCSISSPVVSLPIRQCWGRTSWSSFEMKSKWKPHILSIDRHKTRCYFRSHVETSSARTNFTRVSATNNSIATSLISHLGYSDKVGMSNERNTSWQFSDDCAVKSNGD
jgi:hypothetical protein